MYAVVALKPLNVMTKKNKSTFTNFLGEETDFSIVAIPFGQDSLKYQIDFDTHIATIKFQIKVSSRLYTGLNSAYWGVDAHVTEGEAEITKIEHQPSFEGTKLLHTEIQVLMKSETSIINVQGYVMNREILNKSFTLTQPKYEKAKTKKQLVDETQNILTGETENKGGV